MILTWNVRHFPASVLATHHISALEPDIFLANFLQICGAAPSRFGHGD